MLKSLKAGRRTLTFRGVDAAAVLFGLGQYPRALQYVNRVLAREPENLEALLLRATLLGYLGHYRSAFGLVDRVLRMHPGNYRALGVKAELFVTARSYSKAVNLFSHIAGSMGVPDEDKVHFYSQWINALMGAKRWHAAQRVLAQALRSCPRDEMLEQYEKELIRKRRRKHGENKRMA